MGTIREIEMDYDEDFDEAISDFYESCIRTGHYDMSKNASFFCRENDLDRSEYARVFEALSKLDEEN